MSNTCETCDGKGTVRRPWTLFNSQGQRTGSTTIPIPCPSCVHDDPR